MLEVGFRVMGARVAPHTVTPTVLLDVEIRANARIASGQLSVMVMVQPELRGLDRDERARLTPLLGEPDTAAKRGVTSIEWTRATLVLSAFEGRGEAEIALPAQVDFEAGIGKVLGTLEGGVLPIGLAFRGALFRETERGIELVPIGAGALVPFRLPLEVVRLAIARCLGTQHSLLISPALHDRLTRHRLARGGESVERMLDRWLDQEGA